MAHLALLILCALPAATHQLTYSSLRSYEKQEATYEMVARRTFAHAASLLEGLETDLSHLSKALHGSRSATSLMQLSSAPAAVSKPKASSAPVAAPKPKASSAPVAAAKPKASSAPVAAAKPKAHKKGIDAATAVKEMAALRPEQMPAMLGLLGGMYDSWKDKIGEANKHEQEQKKAYEKTIKDLESKKAAYKDSKDAQATYDRIEKYWKRQREISHRQYHTALKIMHSGMQKFKSVSAAMSNAIAGKKPSTKDLQTMGLAMPDIVFLQTWATTASQEVHNAKVIRDA